MSVKEIASSTEHCHVEALTNELHSKIWFKTEPLDRAFCYRVVQLQLYTDSHDQGFVDDNTAGSWSWFELAILADAEATEPVVKDDKELVWRSHSNRMESGEEADSRHFGIVFDRRGEILDALEVGNVIAVRVCAQFPGWTNDAREGHLVASILDHDLFTPMSWTLANLEAPEIPETIKDGLYTLTPSNECHISAESEQLTSRMWFTTPVLDEDTIEKIKDIKLYTTAHSQGFVEDEAAGSWSWFDVAVLNSPEAREPKVKDGRSLVWLSHTLRGDKNEYENQEGKLFDRSHELLYSLEVGDVIAVRVCARFPGWENHCRDGRLVVRISNQGPWHRPRQPPLADWKAIKKADGLLADALLKQLNASMPEDAKTFVSPVVNLLQRPLRADTDYGAGEAPLRLLSLDGGGVRGLSSLYILKSVMGRVTGNPDCKPCEYFDMIAGTSTGGLIAIMLGRLKMTINECIKAYEDFASRVFSKRNKASYIGYGDKYDPSKLENAFKEIIASRCNGNPDALMFDDSKDKCKVFVVACRADNMNNLAAAQLRTYTHPGLDSSFSNVKIWEAARATSAAPTYFKSMSINGHDYVDGGIGFNNPVLLLMGEARTCFGRARPLGCLLTIGTGMMPNVVLGNWKLQVGAALIEVITTSERTHLMARPLVDVEVYYRFNIGVPEGNDNWKRLIEMDDYKQINLLVDQTGHYMEAPEEKVRVEACAARLSITVY